MRSDQFMRGLAVAVLTPALGQHEFLLRLQHRKPPDFFEVAGKSALDSKGGKRRSPGQGGLLFPGPQDRRAPNGCSIEPTATDTYRFRVRRRKGGKITWA